MIKKPIYNRVFDYDKRLLPNEFLKKLENGVTDIESAKEKSGFSIGYPGWNLLYFAVLCSLEKNETNYLVETGTNYGCSSIVIAQALKDSKFEGVLFTTEIDKNNFKTAKINVKEALLDDYIKLSNMSSFDFLSLISKKVPKIRFAFLDGSHNQSDVIKEFELIYHLLDHKSIVAFDNTYKLTDDNTNLRVNGALKYIQKKYKGNIINFENVSWYTPGIALWQMDPFRYDWR